MYNPNPNPYAPYAGMPMMTNMGSGPSGGGGAQGAPRPRSAQEAQQLSARNELWRRKIIAENANRKAQKESDKRYRESKKQQKKAVSKGREDYRQYAADLKQQIRPRSGNRPMFDTRGRPVWDDTVGGWRVFDGGFPEDFPHGAERGSTVRDTPWSGPWRYGGGADIDWGNMGRTYGEAFYGNRPLQLPWGAPVWPGPAGWTSLPPLQTGF